MLTFKHPKEEYTFVKSVVFKGGTSLSKAFRLIDRFSEDVDIAVMSQPDWTGNKVNNYFPVNFEYINQLPEGRKVR